MSEVESLQKERMKYFGSSWCGIKFMIAGSGDRWSWFAYTGERNSETFVQIYYSDYKDVRCFEEAKLEAIEWSRKCLYPAGGRRLPNSEWVEECGHDNFRRISPDSASEVIVVCNDCGYQYSMGKDVADIVDMFANQAKIKIVGTLKADREFLRLLKERPKSGWSDDDVKHRVACIRRLLDLRSAIKVAGKSTI